jgi:hypothetical protein
MKIVRGENSGQRLYTWNEGSREVDISTRVPHSNTEGTVQGMRAVSTGATYNEAPREQGRRKRREKCGDN